MKRLVFTLFVVLISLNITFSQKIRNASGTAQFRLEDDMSKEDLKTKLRHHAIINAIEREYGTYVSQESFVDIENGSTQFRILGKTMIRGEWLRTTHENFREEIRKSADGRKKSHELWMSLKIEGQVRELTQPDIDFSFFPSNCKKEICKTEIFEAGEPMYIHFKTPVDGFLSIYVIENDEAFRVLPYQNMPAIYINSVPVEADREYVFFDADSENSYFPDFSNFLIDELIMLTDREEEYVQMYIIFSVDEFLKPGLTQAEFEEGSGYEIPKSLSAASLVDWLEKNRIENVNFYYRETSLRIVQ